MNVFFENSDDLFKISLLDFKQNSDTFFINEIISIINIMESILYKPPYSILFGRISIEYSIKKSVENDIDMRREIDDKFYEGFGIY